MVYLGYSLFIRYALATDSCVGHQNPVVISAPSGYVTVFVVGVNHSVETILMISSHNIRHILLIGGTSHILIYDGFTFPHSMLIFGNSRETSKLIIFAPTAIGKTVFVVTFLYYRTILCITFPMPLWFARVGILESRQGNNSIRI